MDVYGAVGDVEGLCAFMDRVRDASESWGANVMDASVYEGLVKALAPQEKWREAEAFVQVLR